MDRTDSGILECASDANLDTTTEREVYANFFQHRHRSDWPCAMLCSEAFWPGRGCPRHVGRRDISPCRTYMLLREKGDFYGVFTKETIPLSFRRSTLWASCLFYKQIIRDNDCCKAYIGYWYKWTFLSCISSCSQGRFCALHLKKRK